MKYMKRAAAVALTAATLPIAAPSLADGLPYAAEVDSCVAAVYERVDLTDANRVRHLVTESRRTAIGYALTIETSVFSADSEKHYAVHCLARGHDVPLKLRIDDLAT